MTLTTHQHGRDSLARRYVYSVLSRRAGGISLGVNLNPDRICNWACAYCQVAREDEPKVRQPVALDAAAEEITEMLESAADGSLLEQPLHRGLPSELRRVVDLSFSGDGEPTTCPEFGALLDHAIAERTRLGLNFDLVVLSNNSMAHRPSVEAALSRLAQAGGRLHAKLDAGDEVGYLRVDRSAVPWAQSLENLTRAAQLAPLIIQTLICSVDGVFMGAEEARGYASILTSILDQGGTIERIDLHTVARKPPFDGVKGLPLSYLQSLAQAVGALEPRVSACIRCTGGASTFLLEGAPLELVTTKIPVGNLA